MARISVGVLKRDEAGEAHRIMRLAFGTYLGLADPLTFLDDRNYALPRSRAANARTFVARDGGRPVGFCAGVQWGSFAVLGPVAVLPQYWNQGVAQRLLGPMTAWFDASGVRDSGLLTFADSPRHVGLYQKFGYWPTTLIATLHGMPEAPATPARPPLLLSSSTPARRRRLLAACRRLSAGIYSGLDLTAEIDAVEKARAAARAACGNEVVIVAEGDRVSSFAVCLHGAGTEAGSQFLAIKFAAVAYDSSAGGARSFAQLIAACEAYARTLGVEIECGINLARRPAYEFLRARGYHSTRQTIAMVRPRTGTTVRPRTGTTVRPRTGTTVRPRAGRLIRVSHGTQDNFVNWAWNHPDAWVLDDWR